MKLAILAVALMGVVAADVVELNTKYLPPVHSSLTRQQHVTYQSPIQEVVDNSVVDDYKDNEKSLIRSGLVIEKSRFQELVAQQLQNDAAMAHQLQTHAHHAISSALEADEPSSPGSGVYHSTQQQDAYYTQNSQQQAQPQQYYTSPVVQQQKQEQPQQYYTGAIVHQQEQEQPQQYYTGANVQQQEQEQPQLYYTGVNVQQQEQVSADVPAPLHEQQQQQYQPVAPSVPVSTPIVQGHSQQQTTGYYGQQAVSAGSSASAGIDTQYAANGGYVY